jgi:three-Cys-motif partner protein
MKDRWPALCRAFAQDDGLPVREVGSWTEDKLYFWNRYIDITTRAMVGHPKWPEGLVYVDLFAGPGVCFVKESRKRVPGSALIAANAPKPFRFILASELDAGYAEALSARLKASPAREVSEVFPGDCNTRVNDIAKKIPRRALTLAFIDPENLEHFSFAYRAF